MTFLPKPIRVRKQGLEWMYQCGRCGVGRSNDAPLEVNIETGMYHCFRCGVSGKVKLNQQKRRILTDYYHKEPEHGEVGEVPKNLHRIFLERGVDPDLTIHRYHVGWDGSRLCWKVGDGWWKRAVFQYQTPKVLSHGKGVLGGHLMEEGGLVVVTEGDWKAASIPLPWIGVAIGGTKITKEQCDIILASRPSYVIIMLDGGVNPSSMVRKFRARGVLCSSVTGLPEGQGPDDVPMPERIALLTGGK